MNKETHGNLSLTRKVGESLIIGEETVVTIVEIQGGRVRIAVKSPKGVALHRAEILSEDHPIREVMRGA